MLGLLSWAMHVGLSNALGVSIIQNLQTRAIGKVPSLMSSLKTWIGRGGFNVCLSMYLRISIIEGWHVLLLMKPIRHTTIDINISDTITRDCTCLTISCSL